jgi:hypothetical protein
MIRAVYQYYEIFPQVVRAGFPARITIHPRYDPSLFNTEQSFHLTLQPIAGTASQATNYLLKPDKGSLQFDASFPTEGEYSLILNPNHGERSRSFAEFKLYALEQDLFERRPFKGDLHMHSNHSDGRESPPHVAAACRRIGLDFMAITDHAKYEPSIEAIRAFEGLPVDLKIFPGEEVHSPDHPVHIVNFGGRYSVNELFNSESYHSEVRFLASQLPPLKAGIERLTAASCLWTFEKIRQAGGLGIFCHPYWISLHRYDTPALLTEYLLERQPFDALELIGGYFPFESDSNHLQVIRYHEARAAGKKIPIVGVSDAHGCERSELFGWYYTLVFSPSQKFEDLVQAIKSGYSVAIEAMPAQPARSHGPLRLVQYAQFLLREVLPQHDELCFEEGRQMLAYLSGDPDAVQQLTAFQGRTHNAMESVFGKRKI